MNEFKFQIMSFFLIALLGVSVYWAFTTLDSGTTYTKENYVVANEIETTPLISETLLDDNTEEDLGEVGSEQEVENGDESEGFEISTEEDTSSSGNNSTNASLIADINTLVDGGTIYQPGSNGDAVGTIQEFLDVYFTDVELTIDKDFGPTTTRYVKEFQEAELGGGDGRVGPNTFRKMIEILN